MSRKRVKKAVKVINVTIAGEMTTFNVPIPTTNQKGVRERVKSISPAYKALSADISKKVAEYRNTKQQLKKVKNEINHLALRNLGKMFDNTIEKAKDI